MSDVAGMNRVRGPVGMYTVAGFTLRVIDAHNHELITSKCELCPRGLFIAGKSREHGLAKGSRVLVLFRSGDLEFDLGATAFLVGFCAELGVEGIGFQLDSLNPEVAAAMAPAPPAVPW